MDKKALYWFSERVKLCIENGEIDKAANFILASKLNEEEENFLYSCLMGEGYNPEKDVSQFFEGDNSQFLELVKQVRIKLEALKDKK